MDNKRVVKVVASVIINNNEVLVAQRGGGKFEGLWEFPGGKIEIGETPEQALARELKEEMGIEIEVGNLLKTIEYEYPDFILNMYCYSAKIKSGDIQLYYHKDYKFVSKENILDLKWVPADLGFVEELRNML